MHKEIKKPVLRVDYIQQKGIYFELNPVKMNRKYSNGEFRYLGDVIKGLQLSVKSPRCAETLYPYEPAVKTIYKWARHEILPALSVVIALAKELNTNAAFLLSLTDVDKPDKTYQYRYCSADIRKLQRISREALGSSTGISYQHIGRLENDEEFNCDLVKLGTLLSVASAFDVSIDYLLGLTDKAKWENSDEICSQLWDILAGTPVRLDFPSGEAINGVVSDDKKYIYLSNGKVMSTTDVILSDVRITRYVLKEK